MRSSFFTDEFGQDWEFDGHNTWTCLTTRETMSGAEFCQRYPQFQAQERQSRRSARSGSSDQTSPLNRQKSPDRQKASRGNGYVPSSGASHRLHIDDAGRAHRSYR